MKYLLIFISLFVFPVIAFSQCDYSYGKWDTNLSSMPVGRYFFSAVTYNDLIYILGGIRLNESTTEYISSVDIYDPANDTWDMGITEIPFPMGCPNACLIDNKIYIMGGVHLTDNAPEIFDSVFIYDIQADSWETGQSMPVAVSIFGADTINGKIYVAGGGTKDWGIVKNLYVYDPVLDEWTERALMNVTRRASCAQSWNGKLYVFGGYSGSNWSVTMSIEVYDPETDQWTLLTPAHTRRTAMGMSFLGNQLLVFGGIHHYSGSTYYYTDIISGYDLLSDSWLDFHSPDDNIPGKRQFLVPACVDEKVYIFGGYTDNSTQNNVWAYSLKNIRQNMEIRDTLLGSESIEIDLAKYFSSTGEEELNYGVCQGYNEDLINASIENSILKIDRLTQDRGSTEIAINVSDNEDTISSNSFTVNMLNVGIQNYDESQFVVYPNPASSQAVIKYSIAEAGMALLEIYNSMGQVIEQFNLENIEAGAHSYEWSVKDYYSGLYFTVLITSSSTSVCKLVIRH